MFGQYHNTLGSINNLGYPTKMVNIGTGEHAAINTIDEMLKIIKESSGHPYVRQWAERLISKLPARDQASEAAKIYYFLRDNCRYTPDPLDLEYVQTPPLTLQSIEAGQTPCMDCDDYATTAASLLRSIGIPCRITITSYFGNHDWSHVYCEALIGQLNDGTLSGKSAQWVTIDPIKNDKPFGWRAPNPTREKHFYIENES